MKRLLIILLLSPVLLLAQKQGQDAIDSMLKRLPAAKEDTDKVKLLNSLSFTSSYTNPDEGIKYGQQALELASKLGWGPGIGRANNCLGINYYDKSDNVQALSYLSKSISVYEGIDNQKMIAGVLNNMGGIYADQCNYTKALECLFEALKIAEEARDKVTTKNSLSILGNLYFQESDFPLALEYYFRALKISEELGDKDGIAANLDGIGNVYESQKNFSKAFEYYNKDLKIVEETGNKMAIADVNTNIGCNYDAQNDHKKALKYFFNALKINQEIGQKRSYAIVSMNIGNCYAGLKNYPLAIAYMESALKMARDIHDEYVEVQDMLAICDAYLGIVKEPDTLQQAKMNEDEPAEVNVPVAIIPKGKHALLRVATDQLQDCLIIAKEIHAPDIIQACYEHLAEVSKLSGNYKQAMEYADNGRAIKDSLFSSSDKIKITNLETKRALDLKEKQIELDKLDLAKKHNERFFYITAIILLIAIGLLFINRQYLKNRKAEAEKKNAELWRVVAEKDKDHATHLLNERIKELATIYMANNILLDENKSIAGVFNEIVNLLPSGWQYPDVCAGRIVFEGKEYTTSNYVPSSFKQEAPIKTQDGRAGFIEVVYTKEMPNETEGPFLKEERDLINALADIIEVYFNKKSNQDALAKSEANFRSSFEHAAIGMALVAADGTFMKVNNALCNMLGYTEKELLSLIFPKITHPEHVNADVENIRQILAGEKDYYRTEKRYIHKNGSVIWANLNTAIIRDSSSQPLYFVSQIENITERKESQQKFQDLVEKSLVGVYIIQNGRYVYVNPRIIETSGYTEEELLSVPIGKSVHKDDIEAVQKNIEARLDGKLDEARYEVRAFKKSGEVMWLEMFGTTTLYRGAPAIIGTMVDITEQKRSQELIRKSQAELSAFFDNVEGSACLIDANKRYLIFNRSFIEEHKRLTGKDPMPGMEIYEFFPPEVKAERHAMLDEVLKGNKQALEVDYMRDGRRIFYRTTFNPVISDGKVIGISTYSIDLSEIKNAELEILRLNRLYQFISQINESMLKLENREQIYADACRIAVEVGKFQMAWIGTYDKQEDRTTPIAWAGVEDGFFDAIDIAGMKVSESVIPSARAILAKTHFYYNDIATDPEIPPHVKAEMLKRNYLSGVSFPIFVNDEIVAALVLLMSEPFFFNDEEVQLLREVTDNITYALDKIRIRELHDKSEANLKSIFDTTHVSYLLLDSNFMVLAYNQHIMTWYSKFTGVDLRVGDSFIDQARPERRESIKKIYSDVIANSAAVEYETIYTKGKETMYVMVTVSPIITNAQTIGICITGLDITNRKLIEIERQKMITDLLQRNRDLEQFSHIVSHNVRGPLATILGLNIMLNDEQNPKEQEFILEGIRTSSEKLDSVVKDLNEILQVRRELSESRSKVNLAEVVSEIKGSISVLMKESNTEIDCDFTAVSEILTVRSYMNSIFFNLITNSIKYAEPGKAPEIKIWTERANGTIIIYFKDNGIGIDLDKYRDRIFMLYNRFNYNVEGKGVGLFMTKTQVEVLNGTIEIDSEPGLGTTFKIVFPV